MFLRKAAHQHLGLIREEDVAFALRETAQNAGKTIGNEALQPAVKPIGGFPFMMQQGVIVEPDRGIVCFGMSYLREHLEAPWRTAGQARAPTLASARKN